jgi:hypothetical protein
MKGLWWVKERSPDGYPDAITLLPDIDEDQAVEGIDQSSGASVKDSYADLDLWTIGFSTLFEAHWITANAVHGHPELRWLSVHDEAELTRWETAHGRRTHSALNCSGTPRFASFPDVSARGWSPGRRSTVADRGTKP